MRPTWEHSKAVWVGGRGPATHLEMRVVPGTSRPTEWRAATSFEVDGTPLSSDRFGVHFTADAELRDLIERARALARHRLTNGDLASLMKLMVASFVRHEERRRFGVGARPRRTKRLVENKSGAKNKPVRAAGPQSKSNPKLPERETHEHIDNPTPPGEVLVSKPPASERPPRRNREPHRVDLAPDRTRGRYLPVAVRSDVLARDTARCAFVSADGRRCSARAFLQFDHI